MNTQETPWFRDEQAISRDIPDSVVEQRERGYLVEYGVRVNDNAMVFHFFPIPDNLDAWKRLEMPKRLEAALPQCFELSRVTAGYEPEYDSFYVIAGGYGNVPDPRGLAHRFLSRVDAAP